MSEASTPRNSRRKCPECGLVNAGVDEQCRRCGALVLDEEPFSPGPHPDEAEPQPGKRNVGKRIVWVLSATLIILIIWYVSLLFSSETLQPDQYLKVDVAIGLIEQTGL